MCNIRISLEHSIVGESSLSNKRLRPRPDAKDPVTGDRYEDIIVIWVESEADKHSLVDDPASPFFTTEHFNGHDSVLIRASDLEAVTHGELKEIIQDAWLSRASARRAAQWLNSQGT